MITDELGLFHPGFFLSFLWLLANNKIPTRDNLIKRENMEDKTCLFCSEAETVHHLFLECCVAKYSWEILSEILNVQIGQDFVSVAKLWLQNKKYKEVNMCTAALLWTLWKSRNDLVFQGAKWTGMRKILGRCASLIKNWRLLLRGEAED
jgi:hypothetical protein